MDPATIIGTTSAILGFVQFTGKVISVAYKIHDSADGATDDNRSLEEAVTDFQNWLENLRSIGRFPQSTNLQEARASLAKTDAKNTVSLLRTARECEKLSSKILDILIKTKAKANQLDVKQSTSLKRLWKRSRKDATGDIAETSSRPSFVEGIRASIQTVWQKDKIDALRQQWEICVIGLNMDLQRLDADEKHDIICAAFLENSEQVGKIEELVDSLVQQSQISKLECFQSFVDNFKEVDAPASLEKRNTEQILRALEFEGMNARRQQVESTVGDTFEWIITDDAFPEGHPDLKISFKMWLSDGTGIYHITGKPGSGKSTLMKLIDQDTATQEQLKNWASRTGERLIIARFYTWKAASAHRLQNQEEGLTRTLLHEILTAAPELTPVIFAKHSCWTPQEYRFIEVLFHGPGISKKIQFEPEEILAALESVLRIHGYKFFILIDGMDEFEKAHNHYAIAKRVLLWSSSNLNRVKICVSSREDNAFMDKFSADQRLRLHIVTESDVRELVTTRLMEHDVFVEGSTESRQFLIEEIVTRAEGVFLWVVLTIQELKILLNDRQSLRTLWQAVHKLPKDLEDFFRETLRHVPAGYKKESEAIFSIVTSYLGTQERYLSLFHFSMVQNFIENDDLNIDHTPRDMSLDEAVSQIQEFRCRLPSLCKGLLETTSRFGSLPAHQDMNDEDKNGAVQCNHRSVFDFLRSFRRETKASVDFDFPVQAKGEILAICSVTEVIKAVPWNETIARRYKDDLPEILCQILDYISLNACERDSIFAFLRALDATLLAKQGAIEGMTPFDSTASGNIRPDKETVSVFSIAFQIDFCEYVDWASKNYPPWILTGEAKSWVAGAYFSWLSKRLIMWNFPIRCLTKGGWLSINEPLLSNQAVSPSFFPVQRGSIWVHNLITLMVADPVLCESGGRFLDLNTEKALLAGAEPRIRFKWWCSEESSNPRRRSTRHDHHSRMRPEFEPASDTPIEPISYHRDVPSGPHGITIVVGDAHKLEWIHRPQGPGKDYIRLIRSFAQRLGKPSGTATLKEILEILLTLRGVRPHESRCLKALDDALTRAGTFSTTDTRSDPPASENTTEYGQDPDTGETTTCDQKCAQKALTPSGDLPSRLSLLGPRKGFQYWQTVLISSLAILLAVLATFLLPQQWWD